MREKPALGLLRLACAVAFDVENMILAAQLQGGPDGQPGRQAERQNDQPCGAPPERQEVDAQRRRFGCAVHVHFGDRDHAIIAPYRHIGFCIDVRPVGLEPTVLQLGIGLSRLNHGKSLPIVFTHGGVVGEVRMQVV